MSLYNSISNTLSKQGYNTTVSDMQNLIQMWKEWYRGSVGDFHFYNIKVAGKTKQCERKTMNMAKKVCEDFRKLLWTEKTQINLSNKNATKRLWSVLDCKENSFTVNFPNFIEKSFALGTGALVEYKKNNKVLIDYIDADLILPFRYTNGYISGVLTISTETEEDSKGTKIYYTHIAMHDFIDNKYTITHKLYKSKDSSDVGKEIDFASRFPNVKNPYEIETSFPYFQILKTNIANNFDLTSPLGISIFANHIDKLKSVDEKYDSFSKEFKLGKKRIVADSTTMKPQMTPKEDGTVKLVQYFDEDDEVFQAVAGQEGQPIKEIDFSLRTQEHIDAINAELSWLSAGLGLGANFWKFDGASVKTATEVISEDSEAFKTRQHHLININDVVYDLVYAICELEGIKTNSITVIPDDSIIEDKNTIQVRAMSEVAQGLRSKKDYLVNIKGMSEDEAQTELDNINSEKRSNADMFGFGKEEQV